MGGERRGGGEQGSALIEAMVACAILAITLTLAWQAQADGARHAAAAEATRAATLEARSRLAEVGADIALTPGSASGDDGALAWRVEVEPAAGSGRLYDVAASAGPVDGRPVVTLHSLRVAQTP